MLLVWHVQTANVLSAVGCLGSVTSTHKGPMLFQPYSELLSHDRPL